ncbi:MAG: SpoIIIAH-like family protein [Clostridiales bacterium]|nr:SpoIIIAH-like family protein [Clostridiales bacterium]
MKKGSIIGKRQIVLAVLVAALGVAVWLNMKFASTDGGFDITGALNSSKYLGDAQYVANPSVDSSGGETSGAGEGGESTLPANGSQGEYFANARKDREDARKQALELLQDTLADVKSDSAAKEKAVEKAAEIAARMDKEASIENLLKAKGFADAVVMIGDSDVNVVVKAESLVTSQTMQIQDAVQSQAKVDLNNIKIVSVK